jgi:hypothetical protein
VNNQFASSGQSSIHYSAGVTGLFDRLCHNHPEMGTALAPESTQHTNEPAVIEIVEPALHASPSEWLFFRELRVGTGRQNGKAQRLDAFALNTLPHTAMKRVCYEVKASRGDFLSELKRPLTRLSVCATRTSSTL